MGTRDKTIHQHVIKSFIKDSATAVYQGLLGNAVTNKNLVVLEDHCIIIRRDHRAMRGKVKIIGGGGSGIEPAEAYYVGKGMLTAAVMGRIFTAPSAYEILIAIRELAQENNDGILLLVKNHLGDKLNFKLAMEQATSEDIAVKMLVIGDDVEHHIPARHGRKGAAGSVLVYKIIGEMAEQGKILEEIIEEYNELIGDDLATASVTLTPCPDITCSFINNFIGAEEMVMGLGIYGKGGTKKIQMTELSDVVSLALGEIISCLKCEVLEDDIVVLVNNLGATTKLEEAVIAQEVSIQLNKLGFRVAQLFVGAFMTCLGSQGFSVSVLKINSQEIVTFLNAPTSAPAWPKNDSEDLSEFSSFFLPVTITPTCSKQLLNESELQQHASDSPIFSEKAAIAMRQIVIFAAEALISCETQLNIIDREAGDGDTGTVLKRAADALKTGVINDEMDLQSPAKFLFELSEICCRYITGLSGALYCVFFKAAAKTFQNSTELTPELCCTAFKSAVKALKCYGNAELGDRTLLDALSPAIDSFESAIKHGKDLTTAVYLAATTCEFKSEETKHIRPPTIQHMTLQQPVTYADAGTHAATIWLRAISEGLRTRLNNNQRKTSALLGTTYYTHRYFTASRWRTPAEVYFYFRESILRQSVESPPVSLEVFEPQEAKDCAIYFCETYMRNLPLISLLHLPHYKLHLNLKDEKTITDQSLFGKDGGRK